MYNTKLYLFSLKDSEANAEEIVRTLKFEKLSADDFDRYWQACSKHRLNEIKACESTTEALEKWPQYKKPLGFRLVIFIYPYFFIFISFYFNSFFNKAINKFYFIVFV